MREWLRTCRKEQGMSQREVAEKSGISRQYYSLIERGNRGVQLPVHIAKSIAHTLKFQWTRFYEGGDTP